jgi:hypothetical protein
VAPFTGTDLEADFVAEVAEQARKVGAEQAQAAETRAAEALAAAESAARAAAEANEQVKPAYEAAAAAARSAAEAARSAADAQQAAAEAAIDGAEARAAGARANQADAQARQDAVLARQAANRASNHAAIAGRAASAAEADAAAANRAATQAENDAAAARNAATAAEADATRAETAAANAQKNADAATQAAKNALDAAVAAQQAADRAEAAQRAAEQEERRRAAEQDGAGSVDLNADDESLVQVICSGETDPEQCMKEVRDDLAAAKNGIIDFLKANGAEIILEVIGWNDLKACFSEGDLEACLWTAASLIPWTKLGPVAKAFFKVVTKIGDYLRTSARAQRTVEKIKDLLKIGQKACKVPPRVAPAGAPQKAGFAAASDDEFYFDGCKPGEKVSDYTKKYVAKLNKICADLGYTRMPDCGNNLWGGAKPPTDADLANPDYIADKLRLARATGISKENVEWLRKYFDLVDKVSTSLGNPSPAGGPRAKLLQKLLEGWD